MWPLISDSLKVFESVVSDGKRSELESLGDAYSSTEMGTFELEGRVKDAQGTEWSGTFSADITPTVHGAYVHGGADLLGRCGKASRTTQANGVVSVRQPCEHIQVGFYSTSFYSKTPVKPRDAGVAIWAEMTNHELVPLGGPPDSVPRA